MESSATRESDRRAEERVQVGKMILIVPWKEGRGGGPKKAWLLDWSPHGVGIIYTEPLKPGDEFGVSLNLTNNTMAIYTVRYAEKLKEDGMHRIGAQFFCFLTPPEEDAGAWARHLLAT